MALSFERCIALGKYYDPTSIHGGAAECNVIIVSIRIIFLYRGVSRTEHNTAADESNSAEEIFRLSILTPGLRSQYESIGNAADGDAPPTI
jgi:hypothetical protein